MLVSVHTFFRNKKHLYEHYEPLGVAVIGSVIALASHQCQHIRYNELGAPDCCLEQTPIILQLWVHLFTIGATSYRHHSHCFLGLMPAKWTVIYWMHWNCMLLNLAMTLVTWEMCWSTLVSGRNCIRVRLIPEVRHEIRAPHQNLLWHPCKLEWQAVTRDDKWGKGASLFACSSQYLFNLVWFQWIMSNRLMLENVQCQYSAWRFYVCGHSWKLFQERLLEQNAAHVCDVGLKWSVEATLIAEVHPITVVQLLTFVFSYHACEEVSLNGMWSIQCPWGIHPSLAWW